jgi:hypothetical protein
MSDSPDRKIQVNLVGSGDDKWPMIETLWDFYSEKGTKTVFMSVGVGANPHADLEIAETLGCPIHIFEVRESILKEWDSVQTILKSRKASEEVNGFLEGVEKKWVLPKNIRLHKELPSFFNGSVVLDSVSYPTKDIISCAKESISSMNLKDDQLRLDIVKVCLGNKYELPVVQAILTAGFRPGIFLVEWSALPDEDLASCITAGHLQTCGYTMFAKYGNKFLYVANDRCMYEICSWQLNNVENPMVSEIIKNVTTK